MDLPQPIAAAVIAHARCAAPEEACGLLAVDAAGRLRMAFCLSNAAASTTRYLIDPAEHFGALRFAERLGWDIGGAYHSHPGSPAVPSAVDIAEAADSSWLYLIIGLSGDGPEVRGWSIRKGTVSEVCLDPV